MNSSVLVSVVVVSYNSEKYVLETLDSIKEQCYKNIELIISDDCSTDHTINLIENWILKNSNSFERLEFLTIEHNTGICANHNRALKYCKGEWVKFVAGDDKLTSNCISEFVNFSYQNPDARFIAGGLQNFDKEYLYKPSFYYSDFGNATSTQQYKYFLMSISTFPGPVMFYHRLTLLSVGGFNEKYNFLEDTPMWYSILQKGYKLYVLNKPIVLQRIHNESLSAKNSMDNPFTIDAVNFIRDVVLPECLKNRMYLVYWHRLLNLILRNPQNVFFFKHSYRIRKYLFNFIDPFRWKHQNKNRVRDLKRDPLIMENNY